MRLYVFLPLTSAENQLSLQAVNLTPKITSTQHHRRTKATRTACRPHTSWKFSTKFLSAEAIRYDMTDFLVFTLIAGTSVWLLIISMVVSVTRLTITW
jgi:hypothetical protein